MRWRTLGIVVSVLLLVSGCSSSSNSASGPSSVATSSAPSPVPAGPLCGFRTAPTQTYDHVIWLLQENESQKDVVGSKAHPYLNRTLLPQCGLATNFHNTGHPSLPNYLALTSGATSGGADSSNCQPRECPQPQPSLFGQVQSSGRQWRQYSQSQPGNCSAKKTSLYEPEHSVPVYFTELRSQCSRWDVPLGSPVSGPLKGDLDAGTLPAFTFISPDGDHESGQAGDRWVADWISVLTSSPTYRAGTTAIFLTWDEGGGADKDGGERCSDARHADTRAYPSCWVATIAISPSTKPATISSRNYTHYSLLRTTEELLGLSSLGAAATAPSMRADFAV